MLIVKESHNDSVKTALKFLREGKIISFATDTVYGIAADAANEDAVSQLYQIKARSVEKPVQIFLKDIDAAKKIFEFEKTAQRIAQEFLPGALTLVLKTKPQGASNLAASLNLNNDGFLAFRIVETDFLKKLMEGFGGAIAVTSANPSGQKAAVSAKEVEKYFAASNIALLIDGGETKQKIASTVAKIHEGRITILRQGSINLSDL